MKPIVIIPALNPDEKLLNIAERLQEYGLPLIVVDDGSDPSHQPIFNHLMERSNCLILYHPSNRGKGAALRTALGYVAEAFPDSIGCVTADADGQHAPEDILKISRELQNNPRNLILGTRDFSTKGVPPRSLLGNRLTSLIYRISTRRRCPDTQTGLRGIPATLIGDCLNVPGERFEYEMNLLMELGRQGVPFRFIPIRTIYQEKNRNSHFNPFRDSFLITWNILKFSCSSLISALADLSLFTLLAGMTAGSGSLGILLSTAGARILSGLLNFSLNKRWVFASRKKAGGEALAYMILFIMQLLASWLLVSALAFLPVPLTAVKILVDGCLFLISYQLQKKVVFNHPHQQNNQHKQQNEERNGNRP